MPPTTLSPVPITIAFIAGIVVTFSLSELYPGIARRILRRLPFVKDGQEIGEGIESCIGNTPLFKIMSLSEYTGCEILAKAEVCGSLI